MQARTMVVALLLSISGLALAPGVVEASIGSSLAPVRLEITSPRRPDRHAWLESVGFPALRDDARMLVWIASGDYGGSLVYTDAASGAEIEREALPEALDEDGRRTIDPVAVARINRRLARYVPLPRAPIEREASATRDGGALRVLARATPEGDDEPGVLVSVVRASDGALLGEHVSHAEALTGVALVPDGSAAVISQFHCACECVSWSTWVPLRAPAPRAGG